MDYDAHIWEDPLPIQKLRELEKISAILYFNSKLKSPDLNFDTILKESESSIYETLHRFNDPLQGCKYLFLRFARDSGCSIGVFDDCSQSFDEVAESLENPEFDWTRNLILKVAPRNGGHAEYFLFRVAKAAVKGQIEILMELKDGDGSVSAILRDDPFAPSESDFSAYLRQLWSFFDCWFFSPVFRRVLENKQIRWPAYDSSSNSPNDWSSV